ncbi:MAG: DNA-processing protein DprA [Clostridia bacterium]|nr:DNA-processing protein DprA [Clostridia bacterium]
MTESMMSMSRRSEQLFWIWLSLRLGAANRLYPQLLERFGSAYDVFEAPKDRLHELVPDLSDKQLAALADKRLEDAFAVEEYCRKHGIRILCYHEDAYPYSYRVLNDPPLLLYCRGELPSFQNQLCVAIVGTRRMSEYGRSMAYKIAYELASAGAIVVSGMALGIDSVAACAAMKAGGKTIAILGGGVDVPYPPEHEGFMNIIANRGVLISEFAPGAEPKGSNFPIRNRLISGLCQATVVIDAEEGSGSLITADRALQQGRDLFAVPANVGAANASGTNRLIRDGAHVALSGKDILSYYEFLYTDLRHLPKNLKSDYDGQALAEMGVYSRVVGGYVRVPAEQAGALPKADQPTDQRTQPTARAPKKAETAKRESSTSKRTAPSADAKPPVEDTRLSPKDTANPGDRSSAAVASLNETQRAILDAIPSEEPIAVDKLKHLGMPMGTLLAAISVLQIKGLVRSLPGGMISRK